MSARLAAVLAAVAAAAAAVVATPACSSPATQIPVTPPPVAPEAPPPPPPSPAEAPPPPVAPSPDAAFAVVAHDFLAAYLEHRPVDATNAGEHRYDGRWPDVSAAGDAADRAFAEHWWTQLAAIPRDQLSTQNRIDATIMDDQLRYLIFTLDQLQPRVTDPGYYTDLIGEGFDPLVNREFGTPASRLASVIGRLDGIPALVAAAKARLAHPSKIATENAIDQSAGLIDLVEHDLAARFPDGKDALAASSKRAAAALTDFHDFLKKDLLPHADGSFRLGREKFAAELAFVLEDNVDIDAIAAGARELLVTTQEDMVETAKQIWSDDKLGALPKLDTPAQRKAFVKKVLDHVAKDHPTNQTILADAKTWLAKATAFVRDQNLVRVPDDPVAVIEMPEYRRGVSVAYCDSSGPLETQPQTFYAIAPTPADWKPERAASFYREYNASMLADLSIHEAMPGHYLQLMHNNQFASKLRAVFSSGAFVEGWAVYGEWLMAEHGFGGPRVKLERQKMALRLAANAILDHDIHAGQMDEKAARALMMGEAFQEDGEATGKWRRARLSSAQLTTYYYGFTQLLALRKAAQQQPGFSERAFHDRLLSFGSPAMKFIRELMATPSAPSAPSAP